MNELPDLTDLIEAEPDPGAEEEQPARPQPPPPPPPKPSRARSREHARVSLVDFERVLRQHPPSVALAPEEVHRRPRWAGRLSLLALPHDELVLDGVQPWTAYAAAALVGAVLAVGLYLGFM